MRVVKLRTFRFRFRITFLHSNLGLPLPSNSWMIIRFTFGFRGVGFFEPEHSLVSGPLLKGSREAAFCCKRWVLGFGGGSIHIIFFISPEPKIPNILFRL